VWEAVATCGTALADGHVRSLTNFARRIVLAYDADGAGQAAAERYYDWERRFEADIRVAILPVATDPADLARADPEALVRAVNDAQPYLAFRLERLFGRADLQTPEGRARAAADAMGMISEHPNPLVRDQYLMQVADRCRVEPGRLRQLASETERTTSGGRDSVRGGGSQTRNGTGGAPVGAAPNGRTDAGLEPISLAGPELEALRLAVHRPADVADRLESVLFSHPLARACFEALSVSATLHDAIEAADPQAADLLQRLTVEETDADTDAVMIRLAERAGNRAVRDLESEWRQADAAGQAAYATVVSWLKLSVETMRTEDPAGRVAALEAEQSLVGWLVARDEAERQTEATR
jgi:DNA primase